MLSVGAVGLQGTHHILRFYTTPYVHVRRFAERNWQRTCASIPVSVKFGLVDFLDTGGARRERAFNCPEALHGPLHPGAHEAGLASMCVLKSDLHGGEVEGLGWILQIIGSLLQLTKTLLLKVWVPEWGASALVYSLVLQTLKLHPDLLKQKLRSGAQQAVLERVFQVTLMHAQMWPETLPALSQLCQ